MISITILKNQQGYVGVECFGHAMYAKAGKDIVCAAVSILVINTINGIERFTQDGIKLEAKEPEKGLSRLRSKDNYIHFELQGDISSEAKVLMDVLVLGLTEMNKQYGDSYLTLSFKEV